MTKNELSLLLYLETRAVDYAGVIDQCKLNDDDRDTLDKWTTEGFVQSGRICFHDIEKMNPNSFKKPTHWVVLSDEAWTAAHAERRARAIRMETKRSWKRAGED